MAVRVGINGFGRIGRAILRLSLQRPEIEVVHINDLSPASTLAHMFRYDSVHGVLAQEVEAKEDHLLVAARKIRCSAHAEPKQIPWSDSGAEIVLECTGKFRDRAHAQGHIQGRVRKLIISAPGKESDVTLVMGVNHSSYDAGRHQIISNASCTTNCLAPILKVMDEVFGIEKALMTTVHSYTNDQRLLCGAHKDLRRSRAAALNQIPTSTGAAKAVELVLPQLKGKIDGMAIRVPTPNVSLIDLVALLGRDTTTAEVNAALQAAAQGPMKGIIDYCTLPLVSSDFNGSTFSAVVDGLSTQTVGKNLVKILAWYDNEMGFSQRMIDLTHWIAQQG